MNLNFDFESDKPIYLQLKEQIEDAILNNAFKEETQIPSTTEISMTYKINPATALKGMNLLVDEEILYKKRGLGLFVNSGAVKKLKQKRSNTFYDDYVISLLEEAMKLQLSKEEILEMIERGYQQL